MTRSEGAMQGMQQILDLLREIEKLTQALDPSERPNRAEDMKVAHKLVVKAAMLHEALLSALFGCLAVMHGGKEGLDYLDDHMHVFCDHVATNASKILGLSKHKEEDCETCEHKDACKTTESELLALIKNHHEGIPQA